MALNFIKEQMRAIAAPYMYGRWTADVVYPYYVGELTEDAPRTEDGATDSTMLITGFHRGDPIALETDRQKIKKHFCPIYGCRGNTKDGGAIAVFYERAFIVPSGDADLHKIQIYLKIKQWKGDL